MPLSKRRSGGGGLASSLCDEDEDEVSEDETSQVQAPSRKRGRHAERKRKDPSVPWSEEDMEQLIRLVQERLDPNTGSDALVSWGEVASIMGNRNAKQCREKYRNDLRPDISKAPWSPEEDYVLALSHSQLGNKWSDIAHYLPRRADNTIKNHWYATLRAKADARPKTFLWLYATLAATESGATCLRMAQEQWAEMVDMSGGALPALAEFEVHLEHFTTGPGAQHNAMLQQAELHAAAQGPGKVPLRSATARAAALSGGGAGPMAPHPHPHAHAHGHHHQPYHQPHHCRGHLPRRSRTSADMVVVPAAAAQGCFPLPPSLQLGAYSDGEDVHLPLSTLDGPAMGHPPHMPPLDFSCLAEVLAAQQLQLQQQLQQPSACGSPSCTAGSSAPLDGLGPHHMAGGPTALGAPPAQRISEPGDASCMVAFGVGKAGHMPSNGAMHPGGKEMANTRLSQSAGGAHPTSSMASAAARPYPAHLPPLPPPPQLHVPLPLTWPPPGPPSPGIFAHHEPPLPLPLDCSALGELFAASHAAAAAAGASMPAAADVAMECPVEVAGGHAESSPDHVEELIRELACDEEWLTHSQAAGMGVPPSTTTASRTRPMHAQGPVGMGHSSNAMRRDTAGAREAPHAAGAARRATAAGAAGLSGPGLEASHLPLRHTCSEPGLLAAADGCSVAGGEVVGGSGAAAAAAAAPATGHAAGMQDGGHGDGADQDMSSPQTQHPVLQLLPAGGAVGECGGENEAGQGPGAVQGQWESTPKSTARTGMRPAQIASHFMAAAACPVPLSQDDWLSTAQPPPRAADGTECFAGGDVAGSGRATAAPAPHALAPGMPCGMPDGGGEDPQGTGAVPCPPGGGACGPAARPPGRMAYAPRYPSMYAPPHVMQLQHPHAHAHAARHHHTHHAHATQHYPLQHMSPLQLPGYPRLQAYPMQPHAAHSMQMPPHAFYMGHASEAYAAAHSHQHMLMVMMAMGGQQEGAMLLPHEALASQLAEEDPADRAPIRL